LGTPFSCACFSHFTSFFWYTVKILDFYLEYGDESGELTKIIAGGLENSWIDENIAYADAYCL